MQRTSLLLSFTVSTALICLNAVWAYTGSYTDSYAGHFPTAGGWHSPTGMEKVKLVSTYLYNADDYISVFNRRHAAVDIFVEEEDSDVYAIAAGTVLAVKRETAANFNESVVTVRHETDAGVPFCAIYGHVYSSLDNGTQVTRGQVIGEVKKYNSPHIHFGINRWIDGDTCSDAIDWGMIPADMELMDFGFVEPFKFLRQPVFSDVPSSSPYYDAIMTLYENGVIDGYPDGTFGHEKLVNRAEFSKMTVLILENLLNKALDPSPVTRFPEDDIISGEWYVDYISKLHNANIIAGYKDGYFRPDKDINFAEMSKMLVLGILAIKEEEIAKATEGQDWFAPYLRCAKGEYLFGTLNIDSDPLLSATREQAAYALYKSYQATVKENSPCFAK